jgi:hypothetical protein
MGVLGMGGMGMGMPGLGGVGMAGFAGRLPYVGGYQGAEFFDEPVQQQKKTHLGYYQQSLSAFAPVWQDNTNALVGTALVGVTSFDTNAHLPDSRRPFPSDLWLVNLGSNYRHRFDNGVLASGGVTVGSPSDRPFSSLKDMSFGVNASFRIPSGERNAWILGAALSSNSQVLQYIPVLSIGYLYSPNPTFFALIGYPVAAVMWRPTEDWIFLANYSLLTNFQARINYRLVRQVYLFVGVIFENQNYWLADRTKVNERFYMYDNRVSSGIQTFLGAHVALSLSGGYIFGRRFFESTNGTSSSANEVDVESGAFAGASVQVLF